MSVSTYPGMMVNRLENRIRELEGQLETCRCAKKILDNSRKQVRDKVRGPEEMQPDRYTTGNFNGLVEGEGPMGDYGDV